MLTTVYSEFKVKNDIKQYFNDSLLISYHEQTESYKRNCNNDPMCLVWQMVHADLLWFTQLTWFQDSLEEELDSSVMPITYSVHLFANAFKMAFDQKCKYNSDSTGICRNLQSMPTTEWTSVLRTASTIMNGPEGPKRVRFQMEIAHHVSIYMWNTIPKHFDLVIYIIIRN